MNNPVLLIILLIHIVCSLIVWFVPSCRKHLRKEYIIPILFVPIFGPAMALTIELLYKLDGPGTKPVELEALKLDDDIYWKSFKKSEEEKNIIPLEEAILLNDKKIRRKAVLNTFRDDSMKYMDVLLLARDNEDVDTTHYATIQISRTQRDFELKLQKYSVAFENNPNDAALLDDYIDLLDRYIESDLAEELVLKRQRTKFSELLDKKLSIAGNDKKTLIRKLRNCIELKEDYATALDVVEILKKNWPDDEQTWIEALRVYVEWQDQQRFSDTVNEIKTTHIAWTKYGKLQVRPWVQV